MHPAAREQRLADGLELGGADLAARGVQDPHAPRHFRGCPDIAAEQSAGPVDQRLDVRAEQARVHLLEQLAEREEGPDLGLVQPQPGKGVARRGRGRLLEAVPARLPIPCDRGVQPVAEILEVALEGGARDFELLEKGLDRDHPPLAQQGIDPVEAFGPVHSPASSNLPRLVPLVRSTLSPLRRAAIPDPWDGPCPPMSRDRSLAISRAQTPMRSVARPVNRSKPRSSINRRETPRDADFVASPRGRAVRAACDRGPGARLDGGSRDRAPGTGGAGAGGGSSRASGKVRGAVALRTFAAPTGGQ